MKYCLTLAALTASLLVCAPAGAQDMTWAERLGYPKGKRVLMFHADDVGMCSEANQSVRQTLPEGQIQSAAAMVPCPWFDDFAAWAKARPQLDVGLHLTLTSEWRHYRWTAILPKTKVPGLYDTDGYMPRTVLEVAMKADAAQVEAEIRAQVERSLARGLRPGHLDTHMGTLFAQASFTKAYLDVAQDYGIPAMVIEMTPKRVAQFRKQGYPLSPELLAVVKAYPGPKLDNFLTLAGGKTYEETRDRLFKTLRELEPGITEIIFHPSVPTVGLKAITNRWQQRVWEHQLFRDPKVQAFFKSEGLLFTDWKKMLKRHTKRQGPRKGSTPRKFF
jgi:chitin disaccharide deacetylase